MDNPEQYLMQVLRRAQLGLQESLLPHHAETCDRLFIKLEEVPSVSREIENLKRVRGFSKAGLVMEWIVVRAGRPEEEFSSDQFEADISLMNETLFEAFLNEPFEPQQEMSDGPVDPQQTQAVEEEPVTDDAGVAEASVEPEATITEVLETQPESTAISSQAAAAQEDPRGLAEIFDQNFMLAFQRFTAMILTLPDKAPEERESSLPMITMIAKGSVDVARGLNRKEIGDFFQSVIKFLSFVNGKGLAKDEQVAVVLRDIGDQLLSGLQQKSGGAALLYSAMEKLEQQEAILNNER
jgi:hypothetical protein